MKTFKFDPKVIVTTLVALGIPAVIERVDGTPVTPYYFTASPDLKIESRYEGTISRTPFRVLKGGKP